MRVAHIGRISASAHPYFEYGNVHLLVCEVEEGQCGQNVEESDAGIPLLILMRERPDSLTNFCKYRAHCGRADWSTANANSLVKGSKVRGGIQTRAITALSQNRLKHCSNRTLTFGPCDMN